MWKIILIAVSLSMDAFSLALSYGMMTLATKEIRKIAITVGLFHFFMPILGLLVGNSLLFFIAVSTNILVCLILTFIGVEMLIESFKEKEVVNIISLSRLLLFALAVSLDSFSVGIGLKGLTDNPIVSPFIFALTSASFTYLGLKIGSFVNSKIGSISTILGGICLIILGILYIL